MAKDTETWEQMLKAARDVDQRYQDLDQERLGRIWTNAEILAATSTDWGELVEGIMKAEGLRPGEVTKKTLEHELADMLWALIVLADRLKIDLASAFLKTMDQLQKRLDE